MNTVFLGVAIGLAILFESYIIVIRLLPIPRPERPVPMSQYETAADVVFKNDPKFFLSGIIPVPTLLAFLFLPVSVCGSTSLGLIGLLLVGAYVTQATY